MVLQANMTDSRKQQLLEEFADYLEQSEFDEPDCNRQPDLNSLLTELAGLKAEVKAESRHMKTLLDRFSESLEALQRDNKALTDEMGRHQQHLAEQKKNTEQEVQRKMVLEFLDVYDRLAAGEAVLKKYKPVDSLFNHSKKQDRRFIKSMREGQEMSVKRMEQLLQSYQVLAIETEGKTLDPQTMTAVATVNRKNLPHGKVVEEIRKGFYLESGVLRLAEVKVNKKSE